MSASLKLLLRLAWLQHNDDLGTPDADSDIKARTHQHIQFAQQSSINQHTMLRTQPRLRNVYAQG
jgi:hypothetical protein